MTELKNLEAAWRPPVSGGHPKQIVFILHGLSGTGGNSIGMANVLCHFLPHAAFIAPSAPTPCDMMYWDEEKQVEYNPGGYQWTSLRDRRPTPVWNGLVDSFPHLDAFITGALKHFDVADEKAAIVGFSQGTMMALHTGLQRKTQLGAIFGFSGRLLPGPGEDPATLEMVKPNSLPPISLVHGMLDDAVPFPQLAYTIRYLESAGAEVSKKVYRKLGHSVTKNGLNHAGRFLQSKIG
jgi:phospholipase/carboxylesterase